MFSKESYDDVVNRLINSIEDEGIPNKHTVRELDKSLKEIKSGNTSHTKK
jgi:hypothetical protein